MNPHDTKYTVEVYDLRMCMKRDNPSPKNIKGDNSRELIICAWKGGGGGIIWDFTHFNSGLTRLNCIMPNILTVLCVFFCITEEDNDADMCSCVDCDSGGHRWKLLRTLILLLLLLLLHLRDIHFLISPSLGRTVYFTSFFIHVCQAMLETFVMIHLTFCHRRYRWTSMYVMLSAWLTGKGIKALQVLG